MLLLLGAALVIMLSEAWFRRNRTLLAAIGIFMLGLPLAWLLLNKGLASNISRHGLYFSGVELLLGTGSRGMDSVPRLFVRWAGIYTLVISAMAVGAVAYSLWCGRVRNPGLRSGL